MINRATDTSVPTDEEVANAVNTAIAEEFPDEQIDEHEKLEPLTVASILLGIDMRITCRLERLIDEDDVLELLGEQSRRFDGPPHTIKRFRSVVRSLLTEEVK